MFCCRTISKPNDRKSYLWKELYLQPGSFPMIGWIPKTPMLLDPLPWFSSGWFPPISRDANIFKHLWIRPSLIRVQVYVFVNLKTMIVTRWEQGWIFYPVYLFLTYLKIQEPFFQYSMMAYVPKHVPTRSRKNSIVIHVVNERLDHPWHIIYQLFNRELWGSKQFVT